MKQSIRLTAGIAAVLIGIILFFCTTDILGEFSTVFVLIGAVLFVYLNPELMRGK